MSRWRAVCAVCVLCCAAPAAGAPEGLLPERVACAQERLHSNIMEKSICGEPREVFVQLMPSYTYQQITPGAVWVRRCAGLCSHSADSNSCVPTNSTIKYIPVHVVDVRTGKQACASYGVREDAACECCARQAGDCGARQALDQSKCRCQCPDAAARRRCLRKRNHNMRWNRYECRCEKRGKRHLKT